MVVVWGQCYERFTPAHCGKNNLASVEASKQKCTEPNFVPFSVFYYCFIWTLIWIYVMPAVQK